MPDERPPGLPADPYKILQVDPEADPEVIQAAYRRLARKYHPDVTGDPGAAARMAAINAAWKVLGDAASRAAHDRERVARVTTTRAGAAPPSAARPPVTTSGGTVPFGRYAGWSLAEIARRDLDYIEWLDRMPIGRPYRDEIDGILRRAGRRRSGGGDEGEPHGLFRRR